MKHRKHIVRLWNVLLIVAVLVAATWAARLRGSLAAEQRQTAWLSQRLEDLAKKLEPAGHERAELETRLFAESNRAARAEARYEEEKATHDPLRRQIETMMEKGLTLSHDVTQKAEQLASVSQSLQEHQAKVSTLTSANDGLTARAKALQDDRDKSEKLRAEIQAQLAQSQKDASAFSNDLREARAVVDRLEKKSAETDARIAALSKEIDAAKARLKDSDARIAEQSNRLAAAESEAQKVKSAPPAPAAGK